jgi:hypothetical protein
MTTTTKVKKSAGREQSEHKIQADCIKWVRARAVTSWRFSLFFAIPNGGPRNAITGSRLKAEGVTPGVPDLFLPLANDEHHGLFIEMKTPSGNVSDAQLDIHETLRQRGYRVEVIRSFDEFKHVVLGYTGIDK